VRRTSARELRIRLFLFGVEAERERDQDEENDAEDGGKDVKQVQEVGKAAVVGEGAGLLGGCAGREDGGCQE